MAHDSCWRFDGTVATIRDGDWGATVDLLQPARGLHDLGCRGDGAGELLGVMLDLVGAEDLSPGETYVRGDDLVATYPQDDVRPFRLQTYYRRVAPVTLELQVSINTDLLDVQPFVDVRTTLPHGTWRELVPQLFLFRPTEGDWSYFEAAHPRDESRSRINEDAEGLHLTHRLFGRPLEKGVIMRSRIRGGFAKRDGDEAAAAAMFHDFAASRLPLTT